MAFAAAALPFMSAAGAGLSAYGAYAGSKATKAAYNHQAQVARNNAQIAEWQAEDALVRGDRAASRVRGKARQLKGAQRAAIAANGIDLGEGSALNILTDTDYFGEIDAATTLDNAKREAWAIRQQAGNFNAEANMLQARAASERPWLAAGTSLLTSAGRVAERWYTPGSSTSDPLDSWRRTGRGGD